MWDLPLSNNNSVKSLWGCSKKASYFVVPSDSEASLASLGTASLLTSFGTASLGGDPSADASGRQQEGLHKNIFSTASNPS